MVAKKCKLDAQASTLNNNKSIEKQSTTISSMTNKFQTIIQTPKLASSTLEGVSSSREPRVLLER